VNANGSVIDRGPPIDFNGGSMGIDSTTPTVKKLNLDPNTYTDYNKNFQKLIEFRRYIRAGLVGAASLLSITLILRTYVLMFFFLIFFITLVYIYYLSYTTTYIVDMVNVVNNGFTL